VQEVEYRLLGPLEVRNDDGLLALGGTKQRALLALLLLNANGVVARARLVDELWGDDPPETAVASVQVYVSRLRKLLPAGALLTRAPGYLLAVEPDAVDLKRFERLTAAARDAEPASASRLLGEALALWRGPPLADLGEETFAWAERRRLEERRLAALEQRIDADLALGRHAEVISELQALVVDEPLRESLRGLEMLALYRAGRQAEALAVYQDARAALVDELGLEPSESLRELEQAILRHDPLLEPPVATDVAGTSLPASPRPMRDVGLLGARKVVTAVYCAGLVLTGSGERPDPEVGRLIVSRFYEAATVVVHRHGGLVEHLVNDAFASVFGLPAVHEDDALRGLRTAVELRSAVGALNRMLERDFHATLEVRIGVSTAEVVTGADERPATGAVLGVAGRLQQAAGPGEILVDAETLALTHGAVDVEQVRPGMFSLTSFEPWPARAPRRLDVPMVGRARERERLRAAFAGVVEQSCCSLVTLIGPAGVGKSRLAREFVQDIEALVVEGRCLPYGEGITYSAAVEVVSQLSDDYHDLLGDAPGAASTIASLLGEAAAQTAPEEIAWAVRKLLEARARERPLVVLLDDVQWGEPPFLDLVEYVASLSTGVPILFVCLARPELLERRPGWRGVGDLIEVEPLARDEVDELIEHLLHGDELDPDIGKRIRTAAQGNPLFVEEMLAMAREAGGDEIVVPVTIKALLAARLDQLEPAERELLASGSIEGELFHRGAVEALTMSPRPVERELVALVRKGLLRPERSSMLRDDCYRFHHLLIRDAAYEGIPKATRAELHKRYADWLGQHAGQAVELDELLGYHVEQAYRYRTDLGLSNAHSQNLARRGAIHLAAAGERAGARGDSHGQVNLLERALALGVPDFLERIRLQIDLAMALGDTGRVQEADALFARTHEEAARGGEDALACRAAVQRMWSRTGDPTLDYAEAKVLAATAIETLSEAGDDHGLAVAVRLHAFSITRGGSTPEAGAELERALVHARASGDVLDVRAAIRTLTCGFLPGGSTPAIAAIARCEELLASAHDDRVLEAQVRQPLALFYAMAGRADDAVGCLGEASSVLDELPDTRHKYLYHEVVVYAHELLGDPAGAESELERMWRYFRDFRGEPGDTRAANAAVELARLYCDQGRFDEAADMLAYGVTGQAEARLLRRSAVRARIAVNEGHIDAAIALAEHAVEGAEKWPYKLDLRARMWASLAAVLDAGRRSSAAESARATAFGLYEQKGNVAGARLLRTAAAA
jgi:DNA-binding SARP family transcriptional activator